MHYKLFLYVNQFPRYSNLWYQNCEIFKIGIRRQKTLVNHDKIQYLVVFVFGKFLELLEHKN